MSTGLLIVFIIIAVIIVGILMKCYKQYFQETYSKSPDMILFSMSMAYIFMYIALLHKANVLLVNIPMVAATVYSIWKVFQLRKELSFKDILCIILYSVVRGFTYWLIIYGINDILSQMGKGEK